MNRFLYLWHRWIALLALIQLVVWSGTGFFFAVVPIERIRGEDRLSSHEPPRIDWAQITPVPTELASGATEVVLRHVGGTPVWDVRGPSRKLLDARTGLPLSVDADLAARIARADQKDHPAVLSVDRIEEAPLEYRERPVPAWRVNLNDGRGTSVYVDAVSGAVTARRNELWRTYDFLWGLHIMDYKGRDDFNNLPLTLMAGLGILTAVSGLVIWVVRGVRWLRRVRAAPAAAR